MKVLLIAYDNGSHISYFPLGIAYLAASCRKAGHNVTIYQQDTQHFSCEHLTSYIDNNQFDVVGVGMCAGYYQYKCLLKLSEAIRRVKKNIFYVIGGHIATPEPEFFLKKTRADAVILGEGEFILCDLLDALSCQRSLQDVFGIAYIENGNIRKNKRKDPIDDLDMLPMPAWDLFEMDHYVLQKDAYVGRTTRTMGILSGRGCSYYCTFCYRLEKGMRLRSCESIMEEVARLNRDYNVSHFHFNDELVMASQERAVELSEAFIKLNLGVTWACAGRLNFVTPEVLSVMKKGGCLWIGYGMESMDNYVLSKMNKELTAEIITQGVELTIRAGIHVGFNFIFGNIGDTCETIQKSVDFLLKYDKHSQIRTIRPVTPYPGSPLYNLAIKKGLIIDCEDFYENKHKNSDLLTVNLTEMTDDEYYKSLYNANKQLLDHYHNYIFKSSDKILYDLYSNRNAQFRGFRTV